MACKGRKGTGALGLELRSGANRTQCFCKARTGTRWHLHVHDLRLPRPAAYQAIRPTGMTSLRTTTL